MMHTTVRMPARRLLSTALVSCLMLAAAPNVMAQSANASLRGQVSGEHGIGLVKKPYLNESLPEASLVLMRGIKKVFDPNNILNPHKVCQA